MEKAGGRFPPDATNRLEVLYAEHVGNHGFRAGIIERHTDAITFSIAFDQFRAQCFDDAL